MQMIGTRVCCCCCCCDGALLKEWAVGVGVGVGAGACWPRGKGSKGTFFFLVSGFYFGTRR